MKSGFYLHQVPYGKLNLITKFLIAFSPFQSPTNFRTECSERLKAVGFVIFQLLFLIPQIVFGLFGRRFRSNIWRLRLRRIKFFPDKIQPFWGTVWPVQVWLGSYLMLF